MALKPTPNSSTASIAFSSEFPVLPCGPLHSLCLALGLGEALLQMQAPKLPVLRRVLRWPQTQNQLVANQVVGNWMLVFLGKAS